MNITHYNLKQMHFLVFILKQQYIFKIVRKSKMMFFWF